LRLPLGFVLAVMISADADNCLGGDCKAFGASSMLQSNARKAATAKNLYAGDGRLGERIWNVPKALCPLGYTYLSGYVPGGNTSAMGTTNQTEGIDICKALCDGVPTCLSFEYSPTSTQCHRNEGATPTNGQYLDYVFCSKQTRGSRGSRTLAPTTTPSAAPTTAPACLDLSGVYLSGCSRNGTGCTTDTLSQTGCSGTSDGGWSYTVDGSTMTIATVPPITGTVTGVSGSYTIVASNGITYTASSEVDRASSGDATFDGLLDQLARVHRLEVEALRNEVKQAQHAHEDEHARQEVAPTRA